MRYGGFQNTDCFIFFFPVIITLKLEKKLVSSCITSQEGISIYRFTCILILDGCPYIEPCAFLAAFLFSVISVPVSFPVHQGQNTSAGFNTCNYEISKEWTCITFKVPEAQFLLLFITDNGLIHKYVHMFTVGIYSMT